MGIHQLVGKVDHYDERVLKMFVFSFKVDDCDLVFTSPIIATTRDGAIDRFKIQYAGFWVRDWKIIYTTGG